MCLLVTVIFAFYPTSVNENIVSSRVQIPAVPKPESLREEWPYSCLFLKSVRVRLSSLG